MAGKGGAKAVTIVFRIAALILAVAATVVMGTASQLVVDDGGGRKWSSFVVSYNQYSSLVYFVAAGTIAAVCAAAGLFLTAVNANKHAGALVPLLDAIAQAFLFSAAGAAFAARGNASPADITGSGGSVCGAAGAFCGRVAVAAAAGTLAAVAVTIAALASRGGAHRRLRRCCDLF
ncbi:hypothetical protein QOZ80_9AG0691440 [Eleusine coracana subsp. coracana]|nr:hypothetical protein QOZ80_9AG0691440 [Eleusine coracana subsp. coracana]